MLCPTCRTRTLVADIGYVDAGRASAAAGGGGGAAEAAAAEAEDGIVVRGSYSTKARWPQGPFSRHGWMSHGKGRVARRVTAEGRMGLAVGGVAGTT